MATDIVGSLFGVTPEVLQQRQMEMADKQAMEYAQLSPLQRASYGLARGGYQLAGALGGQDPQLRMISNRNAIARQIDPTNLESMQMGIQALQQAGDSVGAMQLAQVLRQAENDMALRSQREAAAQASRAAATRERSQAVPASIQEANRISQITQALQNPELSPYERMGLEAEMQQLRKTSTSDSIAVANRIGDLTRALADPNIPELDRRVLQAQYDQLTKAAGQKPNVPDAIQVAQRISALTRQLQNPELAPIERMALEAEMTQLRKVEREGALPASLQLADAISSAQARVDELESQPESPERDRALAVAKRRVENLERQAPQPRTQTQSPALQLAADIENTQALVDALQNVPASAERDATLRRAVTRLDALQRQLPQQRVEKPESFGPDREATSRELFGKAFGDLTQDQQAAVNRKLARPESFGTDREATSREMFSKSFAELTQTQQAAVNRKLEQEAAKRAPTVQNIIPRQEAGVNKNKVELAGQVESSALNATDRITLARNLRSFLPQAFTGLGSDVKLEASRFAAALGIPVTGTTESQIIDQILGQMTIGAAGQLKGALSDKDREFLKQTIGTRGLTRSALEFVSQRIEREARVDERLNEAVQAWQKSGKSLNDFNFVTQRSEAAKQIDADIKRLEELRRKQKGG